MLTPTDRPSVLPRRGWPRALGMLLAATAASGCATTASPVDFRQSIEIPCELAAIVTAAVCLCLGRILFRDIAWQPTSRVQKSEWAAPVRGRWLRNLLAVLVLLVVSVPIFAVLVCLTAVLQIAVPVAFEWVKHAFR